MKYISDGIYIISFTRIMQGLIDFRYSCVAILLPTYAQCGSGKGDCCFARPAAHAGLLVCSFLRPAQMLQLIESNQPWAKPEESRLGLGVRNDVRDP